MGSFCGKRNMKTNIDSDELPWGLSLDGSVERPVNLVERNFRLSRDGKPSMTSHRKLVNQFKPPVYNKKWDWNRQLFCDKFATNSRETS